MTLEVRDILLREIQNHFIQEIDKILQLNKSKTSYKNCNLN